MAVSADRRSETTSVAGLVPACIGLKAPLSPEEVGCNRPSTLAGSGPLSRPFAAAGAVHHHEKKLHTYPLAKRLPDRDSLAIQTVSPARGFFGVCFPLFNLESCISRNEWKSRNKGKHQSSQRRQLPLVSVLCKRKIEAGVCAGARRMDLLSAPPPAQSPKPVLIGPPEDPTYTTRACQRNVALP